MYVQPYQKYFSSCPSTELWSHCTSSLSGGKLLDMSVTLIATCSINLRRCMMILRTMRPEDSSVLMIFCVRELQLTLFKVIHIKDNYHLYGQSYNSKQALGWRLSNGYPDIFRGSILDYSSVFHDIWCIVTRGIDSMKGVCFLCRYWHGHFRNGSLGWRLSVV